MLCSVFASPNLTIIFYDVLSICGGPQHQHVQDDCSNRNSIPEKVICLCIKNRHSCSPTYQETAGMKIPYADEDAAPTDGATTETVFSVLEAHFKKKSLFKTGFILQGFPRSAEEAARLDEFLDQHGTQVQLILELQVLRPWSAVCEDRDTTTSTGRDHEDRGPGPLKLSCWDSKFQSPSDASTECMSGSTTIASLSSPPRPRLSSLDRFPQVGSLSSIPQLGSQSSMSDFLNNSAGEMPSPTNRKWEQSVVQGECWGDLDQPEMGANVLREGAYDVEKLYERAGKLRKTNDSEKTFREDLLKYHDWSTIVKRHYETRFELLESAPTGGADGGMPRDVLLEDQDSVAEAGHDAPIFGEIGETDVGARGQLSVQDRLRNSETILDNFQLRRGQIPAPPTEKGVVEIGRGYV